MICDHFDPITSNCAPSCCVCSRTLDCAKDLYEGLTPEEQEQYIARLLGLRKEEAAQGATNTQDGEAEQVLTHAVSASSLQR